MKPVVLLSYFFPPVGRAGSGRAYGLFRYLPEFGFQPYVVTVKDILYAAHDDTLLQPEDKQHIVRTESLDPSRLLRRLGLRDAPLPNRSGVLSRWITPDFKRLWAPYAVSAAQALIDRLNCQLIITTSPPPSIHFIGQKLKEKNRVRWLADYRDLWVTRPIETAYSTDRQRRRCQTLLRNYQQTADDSVAVNDTVAAYTGAATVITNGSDPDTFSLWDHSADTARPTLTFGYFGSTDSANTTKAFCRAVRSALDAEKLTQADFSITYVGVVNRQMLEREYANAGLANSLRCLEYQPRPAAIANLSTVDALLVTVGSADLAHVTTSKVFDYLVSGKPIIGIAPPDGELAKLLRAESESCFAIEDTDGLTARIRDLIKQRRSRRITLEPQALAGRRERYSWRTMAQAFASRLERLT